MTETQAVIEIDGPPQAYFEVRDNCDNQRYDDGTVITRLRYRTIRVIGDTEDAVRAWMDAALAEIRAWCEQHDAFIIWRARPHFERNGTFDDPEYDKWTARCRLITSHPLPPEIWTKYEVKQGEESHRA